MQLTMDLLYVDGTLRQKSTNTPFQPKTPAGAPNTWIAVSHATSVNGEGKNPAGCLAAVGWLGMGLNQGIAKLEVFSMLTGQVYVSWTSNNGGSLENFPVMAMHLGYTALGLWGNRAAATQPNIYLFHIDSGNEPVAEYSSTGSVMAIDLVYAPYALPPLNGRHQLAKNDQEAKVFLIAAGKLEHATVLGRWAVPSIQHSSARKTAPASTCNERNIP